MRALAWALPVTASVAAAFDLAMHHVGAWGDFLLVAVTVMIVAWWDGRP